MKKLAKNNSNTVGTINSATVSDTDCICVCIAQKYSLRKIESIKMDDHTYDIEATVCQNKKTLCYFGLMQWKIVQHLSMVNKSFLINFKTHFSFTRTTGRIIFGLNVGIVTRMCKNVLSHNILLKK